MYVKINWHTGLKVGVSSAFFDHYSHRTTPYEEDEDENCFDEPHEVDDGWDHENFDEEDELNGVM